MSAIWGQMRAKRILSGEMAGGGQPEHNGTDLEHREGVLTKKAPLSKLDGYFGGEMECLCKSKRS